MKAPPRKSVARREPAPLRTTSGWETFYRQVRRIPRGKVATYGQIAALAGRPRNARQVGYALHALPDNSRIPWHRVINARGEISLRASGGHDQIQRILLEREGVRFGLAGRVDLGKFLWGTRARP